MDILSKLNNYKIMPQIKTVPILVIQKKKSISFCNMKTGIISKSLSDVISKDIPYKLIYKTSSRYILGADITYEVEIDMYAISLFVLDIEKKKANWEYNYTIYVDKDKQCYRKNISYKMRLHYKSPCDNKGYQLYNFKTGDDGFFKKPNFINLNGILCLNPETKDIQLIENQEDLMNCHFEGNIYSNSKNVSGELFNIFYKYFPDVFCGSSNKMYYLDSFDTLAIYLNYKEPAIKNTKNQADLNEFLKFNLKPIPEINETRKKAIKISKELITEKDVKLKINLEKFATIENIKPGLCVLRTFYKNDKNNNIYEAGRIYFNNKDIIAARVLNNGNYIYQKISSEYSNWDFPIFDFNQSETIGTILEYFGSIVDKIEPNDRGLVICNLIKTPECEMYMKTECFDVIKDIIRQTLNFNYYDIMECLYGKKDFSKKNIISSLGFNTYQMKQLNEVYFKYFKEKYKNKMNYIYSLNNSPYQFIKILLSNEMGRGFVSISDIDNKKFDTALELLKYIYENTTNISNNFYIIRTICWRYGLGAAVKLYKKIIFFQNYNFENGENFQTIYRDYLWQLNTYLYNNLNNDNNQAKPNIKQIDFKEPEDILVRHDFLNATQMEIRKIKEEEDRLDCEKKWSNTIELNKKYLFEDDTYSIILPALPEMLISEGCSLNHCVGGYISSMAAQSTCILFLRKKEAVEESFFTIEVKQNCIVQVKGSYNRAMITQPEIIPFLKEWKKHSNLRIDNTNSVFYEMWN